MTIRVTKPAFNLREKLSELDRPVGTHGNEILKSETPQDTFDLVGTGRKNMVINGGMVINQRHGTSASTPTNNGYTLDRMRYDLSQASKFTVQQVTDAPAGFSHSMKVTSSSSYNEGANDYFLLQTMIEGTDSARLKWGTSEAQTVTLSFYVKSSLIGTHNCGIRNNAYDRGNTQTYEINNANTWEYKSVTFIGDRLGTWLTNTGAGLKINFDIGSGSNFEAASTGTWLGTNDFITGNSVKIIGTSGATWYITGIQLETGKLDTPFEHRSYGEELALCQRYYHIYLDSDTNASNQAPTTPAVVYNSTSLIWCPIQHPLPMRTAPSLDKVDGTNYYTVFYNNTNANVSGIVLSRNSPYVTEIYFTGASVTQGTACWLRGNHADAKIAFDAEL